MNETALMIVIIAIPIVLAIALTIGAALLRLGCWVCKVEEPGFLKAMGIVFVNALANMVVQVLIGVFIGLIAGASGARNLQAVQVLATLISLPFVMLVSGGIYCGMIPTSFGKGILIWLVQLAVWIVIALVFALVTGVLAAIVAR